LHLQFFALSTFCTFNFLHFQLFALSTFSTFNLLHFQFIALSTVGNAGSSLLTFTIFVWQVISVLHFPIWKRGIEGDFQRLRVDNVRKSPLVPLFQRWKSHAMGARVFERMKVFYGRTRGAAKKASEQISFF